MMEDPRAKALIEECNEAQSIYEGSVGILHKDLAKYFQPNKAAIMTSYTQGTINEVDGIYNPTPINLMLTLAAGMYDFIYSGRWVELSAPRIGPDVSKKADDWYRSTTDIFLELIATSNFATVMQEHMVDRVWAGNAHIHADEGKNSVYSFKNRRVGKFYIEEDDDGFADTEYVLYEWTPKQVIQRFQAKGDKISEKVIQASQDVSRSQKEMVKVWHICRPRDPKKVRAGKNPKTMPYESLWVENDEQNLIRESGYHEQPFAISRHSRWNDDKYGYSPTVLALMFTRELQSVSLALRKEGENKINPRFLVGENIIDDVDWRSGQPTVYAQAFGDAGMPKEWGVSSDFTAGQYLVEMMTQGIRDIFYTDTFSALTDKTKEMTAYEAFAVKEEGLGKIRPTVERVHSETNPPIIKRCFNIAYRLGLFGEAPPEAFKLTASGQKVLPSPRIVPVSKVANSLKSMENKNILSFLQQSEGLIQMFPEEFKVRFKPGVILSTLARNNSTPTEIENTEEESQAIEEQMAQAQQMAQMAEVGKTGSEAVRNLAQAGSMNGGQQGS